MLEHGRRTSARLHEASGWQSGMSAGELAEVRRWAKADGYAIEEVQRMFMKLA